MRKVRFLILLAVTVLLSNSSASAAELLMFRRDGCPWCQAWDREIGPIYGKTDIGRRVPLRMVDIHRDHPEIMLKSRIVYTPTFVLIEGRREIARIEGYAGEQFFWGLLEDLLQKLPPSAASALSAAP